MKKTVFILFLLFAYNAEAVIVMPRVDVKIFVNKGRTDFDSIFNPNKEDVKKVVSWLFENNQLDHDYTKAVNPALQFAPYWKLYAALWNLVDMNNDGKEELVFSGKPLIAEDKESFNLYVQYGSVWKEIFWDEGHLMAYKKHPRTGEILLFHHRYPCCSQFTHMIHRVRWLNNKVHSTKRYFLARDTGMNGQFFPETASYPTSFKQLKKSTMLYWSKGKIEKEAAQFSPTNKIINFPKGGWYQVLFTSEKWRYVMMLSPPKNEESMVANANNLQESRFYGWIYSSN